MTARPQAVGSPRPPARGSSNAVAFLEPGGVETGALLDELTAVVGGARHEARFIVDEALAVAPRGPAARSRAGRRGRARRGHWRPAGRPGSRCSTCSATGPSAIWTSMSIPVS